GPPMLLAVDRELPERRIRGCERSAQVLRQDAGLVVRPPVRRLEHAVPPPQQIADDQGPDDDEHDQRAGDDRSPHQARWYPRLRGFQLDRAQQIQQYGDLRRFDPGLADFLQTSGREYPSE